VHTIDNRRAPLYVWLLAIPLLVVLPAAIAARHDPPRTKVTWNSDIARIVQARCVRCHTPDGKGPMSLRSYDDARPWARAIREEVLARRMPKWHAARGYGQFANDPTLSPFDINLIVAWVDGGALRGPEPARLLDGAPEISSEPPGRPMTIACGTRRLPAGRLHAITPRLQEGGSAGFSIVFPDGRREIVAWIRRYERAFEETYRLRTPLDLPRGSTLAVETVGACSVVLHIESR
jgi:mono/diheme cytochrome c family protein